MEKIIQKEHIITIYIPIWLDLLLVGYNKEKEVRNNLHSNMVRFIIPTASNLLNPAAWIYIPIWLDLLLTMDEIQATRSKRFTFQYG